MPDLLSMALENTLFAGVGTTLILVISRWRRYPAGEHALWLLLLGKLVSPPLFELPIPFVAVFPSVLTQSRNEPLSSVGAIGDVVAPGSGPLSRVPDVAREQRTDFVGGVSWRSVVVGWWLVGIPVVLTIGLRRVLRFQQQLVGTLPAPPWIRSLASDLAMKFQVRVPTVWLVDSVKVPLVCWWGRNPGIALPRQLVSQLTDDQVELILAHELAHLQRKDHWIRWVEFAVSVTYWWNPLVRLIRRQLHETEDLLCDALVRREYPTATARYAETILQAAEFCQNNGAFGVLPASAFLRTLSLKARLEMLLEKRVTSHLNRLAIGVLALIAVVCLPCGISWMSPALQADEASGDPKAMPQFPYQVPFELGTAQFLTGDEITIDDVWGTDKTFVPGNIYWIKGKYKLASHKKALLAAYTTAREARHATSDSYKVQHLNVEQGEGTFSLFLPMPYDGWPHLSFYGSAEDTVGTTAPAAPGELTANSVDQLWELLAQSRAIGISDPSIQAQTDHLEQQLRRMIKLRSGSGQSSFGGNYFGTGTSVLKPTKTSEKK